MSMRITARPLTHPRRIGRVWLPPSPLCVGGQEMWMPLSLAYLQQRANGPGAGNVQVVLNLLLGMVRAHEGAQNISAPSRKTGRDDASAQAGALALGTRWMLRARESVTHLLREIASRRPEQAARLAELAREVFFAQTEQNFLSKKQTKVGEFISGAPTDAAEPMRELRIRIERMVEREAAQSAARATIYDPLDPHSALVNQQNAVGIVHPTATFSPLTILHRHMGAAERMLALSGGSAYGGEGGFMQTQAGALADAQRQAIPLWEGARDALRHRSGDAAFAARPEETGAAGAETRRAQDARAGREALAAEGTSAAVQSIKGRLAQPLIAQAFIKPGARWARFAYALEATKGLDGMNGLNGVRGTDGMRRADGYTHQSLAFRTAYDSRLDIGSPAGVGSPNRDGVRERSFARGGRGEQGRAGAAGAAGEQGKPGEDAPRRTQARMPSALPTREAQQRAMRGESGLSGALGAMGIQGRPGEDIRLQAATAQAAQRRTASGEDGLPGAAGAPGVAGAFGPAGIAGSLGWLGRAGASGSVGMPGDTFYRFAWEGVPIFQVLRLHHRLWNAPGPVDMGSARNLSETGRAGRRARENTIRNRYETGGVGRLSVMAGARGANGWRGVDGAAGMDGALGAATGFVYRVGRAAQGTDGRPGTIGLPGSAGPGGLQGRDARSADIAMMGERLPLSSWGGMPPLHAARLWGASQLRSYGGAGRDGVPGPLGAPGSVGSAGLMGAEGGPGRRTLSVAPGASGFPGIAQAGEGGASGSRVEARYGMAPLNGPRASGAERSPAPAMVSYVPLTGLRLLVAPARGGIGPAANDILGMRAPAGPGDAALSAQGLVARRSLQMGSFAAIRSGRSAGDTAGEGESVPRSQRAQGIAQEPPPALKHRLDVRATQPSHTPASPFASPEPEIRTIRQQPKAVPLPSSAQEALTAAARGGQALPQADDATVDRLVGRVVEKVQKEMKRERMRMGIW